jgi:glycerol-3-phosphate acyltransferase PlsY
MSGDAPAIAIAIICAYILGSFPTAYIVGRLRKGIDIREVGSRNMGATNVMYQVGIAEGILVLCVDASKGAAAVVIARAVDAPLAVQLVAGGVAVLGHAFPVFLKFHGGKGGATTLGVLATFMPWGIPIYLGIFLVTLLITRYTTFSYSFGLLCVPLMAWLLYDSIEFVIFTIIMLVLLGTRYIPRLREMRATAGSWHGVVFRSSLKERF